MQHYILDQQRNPIPATEAEWRAFPQEKRLVAETTLGWSGVVVRTEFEGLDWETGEEEDVSMFILTSTIHGEEGEYAIFSTWSEAEAAHREIVAGYQQQTTQVLNPLPLFPDLQPKDAPLLLGALDTNAVGSSAI